MQCRIYQGAGPTDAYLVRDWLERNGIPTWMTGETLSALRGQVPLGQVHPIVWVLDADADRAREAIRVFNGPSLVHPEWRCAKCGEENGAAFGSCWRCGAEPVSREPAAGDPVGGDPLARDPVR